eukprot:12216295-Alexandrium_andersonii.AAC.1
MKWRPRSRLAGCRRPPSASRRTPTASEGPGRAAPLRQQAGCTENPQSRIAICSPAVRNHDLQAATPHFGTTQSATRDSRSNSAS